MECLAPGISKLVVSTRALGHNQKTPENEKRQRICYSNPPLICPKPYCGSTSFASHEDGWQCLNCMKIIYVDKPLPYIANNRPERIGQYNDHELIEREDISERSHSYSVNLKQDYNTERSVDECQMLKDESVDCFMEYEQFSDLAGTTRMLQMLKFTQTN